MNLATLSVGTCRAFLTKHRLVWAGAATLAGCAALCSLPMLAAAVLGGGAAAAAASLVSPGTELFFAGMVVVVVLGVMAARAISKKSSKRQTICMPACEETLATNSTENSR